MKFKRFLIKNFDHISNVISAILSIALSILASVVYDNLKNNEQTKSNLFILISLGIFLLALILVISIISKKIKRHIWLFKIFL